MNDPNITDRTDGWITPTQWVGLDTEKMVEGTFMLAAGIKPTIGWWRRAKKLPPPAPWTYKTTEPWHPHDLHAAAVTLAEPASVLTEDDKEELLAELAADHHLDAVALRDAYLVLRDQGQQEAA